MPGGNTPVNTNELLARESIRATMAKYTIASDFYDTDRYLSCFADTATLAFEYFPGIGPLELIGKPKITEFASNLFTKINTKSFKLYGGFSRHHLTSCAIELCSGSEANALTYCLVFNESGAAHTGSYKDLFQKINGDWLIVHRYWCAEK